MPKTSESATSFVVVGDTRLVELREALTVTKARYEASREDGDIGMTL